MARGAGSWADPWRGGDRRAHTTASEARAAGLYLSKSAAAFSSALVSLVCFGYGAVSYAGVLQNFGAQDAVTSAIYTTGILGLQLGYFSRPGARHTAVRSLGALAALGGLVYLPALHLGEAWVAFTGFLAGSLLITLPLRWSIPAYLAVVAGSAVFQRQFGETLLEPTYAIVYSVSATAITGLVIFGLTRLAGLVRELDGARDELSRLAVAEERLRFSRDVHDLLGMNLSAITLKAELGHRLVDAEPERARAEIAEVLMISRRALGEVRMVASGYASLSLAEELVSARSVLVAAEIDTSLRGEDTNVPGEVGTLFATLLREAVTNILRHSKADVCQISVAADQGTARLAITNDRAGEAGELPDERYGSDHRGIANLRARFAERSGRLTVERDDDEFTVVGVLPLAS